MNGKRQVIATSFDKDKYTFSDINTYLSYIARVINKEQVKICFMGMAGGDSLLERFFFRTYIFATHPKWQVYVLTAADLLDEEKTDIIYTCDIVFIGRGKTSVLITLLHNSQFKDKLRKAYNQGVIMGGVGAGLLCWFQHGITDSYDELSSIECLGFLPFSTIPHYQLEERKQLYGILIREGELAPGYGVPDGSVVHFIDEKLHDSVNMRDIIRLVS